jgi:hypothetical protein
MSHPIATFFGQLRAVFRRETLPPPEPERPHRRRVDGLARLLFAVEPLPTEHAAPARRRRSLLALVFAPEHLALEPPLPRHRSRWLSWLLLPERLDGERSPADDD